MMQQNLSLQINTQPLKDVHNATIDSIIVRIRTRTPHDQKRVNGMEVLEKEPKFVCPKGRVPITNVISSTLSIWITFSPAQAEF